MGPINTLLPHPSGFHVAPCDSHLPPLLSLFWFKCSPYPPGSFLCYPRPFPSTPCCFPLFLPVLSLISLLPHLACPPFPFPTQVIASSIFWGSPFSPCPPLPLAPLHSPPLLPLPSSLLLSNLNVGLRECGLFTHTECCGAPGDRGFKVVCQAESLPLSFEGVSSGPYLLLAPLTPDSLEGWYLSLSYVSASLGALSPNCSC